MFTCSGKKIDDGLEAKKSRPTINQSSKRVDMTMQSVEEEEEVVVRAGMGSEFSGFRASSGFGFRLGSGSGFPN